MDFSLFVIIWIVLLVAENVLSKKKKSPPPPTPTESTDGGNPSFPNEDVVIFQDEQKAAEVRGVGTELYRQRKAEQANVSARSAETNLAEKNSSPLNLTAESAMNAIVLSEILGKPKALRRR